VAAKSLNDFLLSQIKPWYTKIWKIPWQIS